MSRLQGFDGMRAIACLLVLFHHLFQRLLTDAPFRAWTDLAEIGVSLFFVLSGALLAAPFWSAYLKGFQLPSLKQYLIHRAARIVPSFYLVLTVSFLVAVFTIDSVEPLWRYLSGLTFIAPYHFITFFPGELNGPLWSIGLEVSCYLLLPIVFILLWPLGHPNVWKALATVLFFIVALQILNPFVIDWFMTDNAGKGWQHGVVGGAKQWLPYWNIVSFFGQFLVGSFAALVIVQIQRSHRYSNNVLFDCLAVLGLILCVISAAVFSEPGSPSWVTQQPYGAPIFSIAAAVALIGFSGSRYAFRVVDNRVFKEIATLSFGIYLWHYLIMELIRLFWKPYYVYNGLSSWHEWLLVSSLVVISSVSIAALSFYYFEKPILKWARDKAV
jgi:peptidoglycan/LPS O-acetylase OafA/YrhL